MEFKKVFHVFTDGGARGNPGPGAVAFVIKDEKGKTLIEQKKTIGWTTNNMAEYTAVIEALKKIASSPFCQFAEIKFFLDSKLVVNQLNGLFKIKDFKLRKLIIEVRKLENEIKGKVSYQHIPRQKNQRADFLVSEIFSN